MLRALKAGAASFCDRSLARLASQTGFTDWLHRLASQTGFTDWLRRLASQTGFTDWLHKLTSQIGFRLASQIASFTDLGKDLGEPASFIINIMSQ